MRNTQDQEEEDEPSFDLPRKKRGKAKTWIPFNIEDDAITPKEWLEKQVSFHSLVLGMILFKILLDKEIDECFLSISEMLDHYTANADYCWPKSLSQM